MKGAKVCQRCRHPGLDLGRASDGRRAYRCQQCGHTWTEGLQGRKLKFSKQQKGWYQFE